MALSSGEEWLESPFQLRSKSLLPRMNDRDVKILMTDRNVPEGLRIAARKMMQNAEARKQ